MRLSRNARIALFAIIAVSFVLRCIAASSLGLGIDEAYYASAYAYYPALSHFDHPPIVGFLTQLTTWNLTFVNELTARLGFVILGTLSLIMFYLIGKKLKNPKTGFFAVCLAAASLYITIYAGLIIIPDTPLIFFILTSFYFFLNFITNDPKEAKNWDMFLAFLFLGLAFYSKYMAVFLAFGVLLYILFNNRKWFKSIRIYLFALIPLFFIGLIFYWNYKNNFVSFAFHEQRFSWTHFRLDLFFTEIFSEFGIYDPIAVLILIAGLIFYHKKHFIKSSHLKLILCSALPLMMITLGISFFNRAYPQWVGTSYILLFFIAAAFLDEILNNIKYPTIYAFVMLFAMGAAIIVVNKGYFIAKPYTPTSANSQYTKAVFNPPTPEKWERELGSHDGTLPMYGWTKVNPIFKEFIKDHPEYKDYPLVVMKYFPGGQTDFYVARPNKIRLVACGPIQNIRGYYFVNQERPGLIKGENALYIVLGQHFDDPTAYFKDNYKYFEGVKILYRAPIYRDGKIVEFAFIYELKDFTGKKSLI